MSFESLGLTAPLLQTLADKSYKAPTPIQAQAIPAILAGRDLLAAAQTGTGKTAGFALPLLQRLAAGTPAGSNRARALVLVPTRELAVQVGDSFLQYGAALPLRCAVVYGGVAINPQMMKLRRGVDVLVATPGRLLDLQQKNAVRFDTLEALVLDEADRMLDLGFQGELQKIMALLPAKRQNLLFSATFSPAIRELAKGFLREPVEIDVNPRNVAADTVQQWLHPVDKRRKSELLSHLIRTRDWRQVLVFTRTKRGADKLVAELGRDGIRAASIHSDKSQSWRAKALNDFKAGRVAILVATDVAARGLDIQQLPQVVNFDLPIVAEDYVHRIGRTGRAGSKGRAISLVSADEVGELRAIERLLKKRLTRDEINGFEPEHRLPESPAPDAPVKKAKKPKKPKKKVLKAAAAKAKSKGKGKSPGKGQNKGNGQNERKGKNEDKGKSKTPDTRANQDERRKKPAPGPAPRAPATAPKPRRPRPGPSR